MLPQPKQTKVPEVVTNPAKRKKRKRKAANLQSNVEKNSNNHLQIIPLLPNLVVVVLELAPPLVGMIGKTMKFLMCPTDLEEEVVQEVVWEVIKEVVVQVLLDNKWRK